MPGPSLQKEILFHKLREEQLRRHRVWDKEIAASIKPRNPRLKFDSFAYMFEDDDDVDKVAFFLCIY